MLVTLDIEDSIAKELIIEAKKDGHENHNAIIRKAIGFLLHHASKESAAKNNVTLSSLVLNNLKKECPKGVKFHCHFADDIVNLGLMEYKKRSK